MILDREQIMEFAASLERYSKHPLAVAILEEAGKMDVGFLEAVKISECPGEGLRGQVGGREVAITGRSAWLRAIPAMYPYCRY